MKIKVVQIALTSASDGMGGCDEYAEYLDDKGRVWYLQSRKVDGEWQAEWKQIELPDEPS